MKKSTTAAIAGGLGFVLLVGGAGSLAYWSDSKDAAPEQISSGLLAIKDLGPSAGWSVTHGASDTTPEAFTGNIVPGDILTKTVNVPVVLDGQNMAADLTVSEPAIGAEAQSSDLAKELKLSIASVDGVAGAKSAGLAGTVSRDVPVVIKVEFNGDAATNAAKAGSVDFGVTYTLTQRQAD